MRSPRASRPSSGLDGCCTKHASRFLLGNYDVAQRKVDEAEPWTSSGASSTTRPPRSARRSRRHGPRPPPPEPPQRPSLTTAAPPRPSYARPRHAINDRHFEQAEAIALEVKGWGLSYGLFEDNPDKVAAAARALRRRDKIRNTPGARQPSQGVYDILVQESRQLMSVGQLDEAEAKARQAQRMNVVPSLTADRAESVLHDIAMARAQGPDGAVTAPASLLTSLRW